jgi:hypothetical protein
VGLRNQHTSTSVMCVQPLQHTVVHSTQLGAWLVRRQLYQAHMSIQGKIRGQTTLRTLVLYCYAPLATNSSKQCV